jgi:cystathionine gamma-synthase
MATTDDRRRIAGLRPETFAVSAGRPHAPGAPLNPPMEPASSFRQGGERGYARGDGTAGVVAFEEVIGGLEGGEAVAFASGIGACAAVFAHVPDGGHVVLGEDLYLGVAALVATRAAQHGWRVERLSVDGPRWCERGEADLLWVETPSNPLLEVADLAAICAAPRSERTTVAVDNTFATPLLQRPLALGADVVVHSATKAIGGHSDLLLGVAVAREHAWTERLRDERLHTGATPGTLECFLALRGTRTLAIRLERASANAAELARRLAVHPAVPRVRYPGFGSMVSFDLADRDAADRACDAARLIGIATSLGGVETTMERRGRYPGQEHLPPGLIRLSVGCEHVDDLWDDLAVALGAGADGAGSAAAAPVAR